jgi:hypothetical protein
MFLSEQIKKKNKKFEIYEFKNGLTFLLYGKSETSNADFSKLTPATRPLLFHSSNKSSIF